MPSDERHCFQGGRNATKHARLVPQPHPHAQGPLITTKLLKGSMLSLGLRCRARLPAFKLAPATRTTPLVRPLQTSASRRFPRTVHQQDAAEVPSFRDAVNKSRPEPEFQEKVGKPRIRNQVLVRRILNDSSGLHIESRVSKFVAFGSFLAFSYAASRTNIETEYWTKRLLSMSSTWQFHGITTTDLKRVQNAELIRVSLLLALKSPPHP